MDIFKESVDNGNEFVALLTDLSKAFDCIDHSLLLAKLYRYGLSHTSLKGDLRPKLHPCFMTCFY